jgi:1,2-phenylacetyl-CoA epoxidase PaaB subunit
MRDYRVFYTTKLMKPVEFETSVTAQNAKEAMRIVRAEFAQNIEAVDNKVIRAERI